MKKNIMIAALTACVLTISACGASAPASVEAVEAPEASVSVEANEKNEANVTTAVVGLANPMTEVGSLEELNEKNMVVLSKPAVMGVTDEKFFSIDGSDYTVSEYDFTVNGLSYCYRAASTTEDISGIYVSDGMLFDELNGEGIVDKEGTKGARWFTLDGQYCLTVFDDGTLDAETFELISDELKAASQVLYGGQSSDGNAGPSDEYLALAEVLDPLSGEYMDSVGQRASLSVTSYGTSAQFEIHWGDSATESHEWTMEVTVEDGKLVYSNCESWLVTYVEDGVDPEMELLSMGGTGYFEIDGEKLLWTGAEEDNCKECVFEKIPQ